MDALLDDLFDYNRTMLHVGIAMEPTSTDLGIICAKAIDEVDSSHPGRKVTFEITGALPAEVWPRSHATSAASSPSRSSLA
jgi:hypothetical protein